MYKRQILQNPDPKVELAIANSLWARQGKEFYEDFLQRNRDYYGAEVAELDFDLPDAAATINRWVERQTAGKITDLIEPPIDPLTVLFLINAIYFKAAWSEPFDPDPVSYTHLDVYKRQRLLQCPLNSMCAF